MKKPCIPRNMRDSLREVAKVQHTIEYFILRNDGTIRPASMMHWANWMEAGHHRLASTFLFDGNIHVSTIFLGFDHNYLGKFFSDSAEPLFFETMIFGNTRLDQGQWRWPTFKDAMLGHMEAVELAKSVGPHPDPVSKKEQE